MDIYLTLDYELFMGTNTGTPENCLVRPMTELCKVAKTHSLKYIIFVDAAYLLRLSQLKDRYVQIEYDYKTVCDNIQFMVSEGHDIELHFHPQWIFSEWCEEDNKWNLDQTHYKLSDMGKDKAYRYLKQAKQLLDNIVGYKTIAFRAGGFCLDDFDGFYELLTDNNLRIDSSVGRLDHISSDIHKYDYRRIPSKQIYRIKQSLKAIDNAGIVTEYSISSVSWNSLQFLINIRPLKLRFSYNSTYGDGTSISDRKLLFIERIKKLFTKVVNLASIDLGSSELLDIYFNEAIRKNHKEIILIGHPKNLTDSSLSNLRNWISKHKSDFFFKTFR